MQAPTSVACTRYPTNPKRYVESVTRALSTTSSDVCQRWYKREIDFDNESISSDFCSQISLPPSPQPDARLQVTQLKVDNAAIRRWISEVDSDLSAPSVESTKRREAPISGARHVQPTTVSVLSRVERRRRNSKGLFKTENDEAQRLENQRRTLAPRAIRQEEIAQRDRSYRG
ncbi:hypothetical protein EYC80_004714 [Monilinia laxa]|uniref:Uncharacterized protein n=1 Tax=Monilinia laxa TaxID=61186 RepID=A0A5N6KHU0_MONLA|nr:hypothetical protein EYC80_004714 [Monilinia laxa]